jgi:hypothetical protein
VLTHTLEKQGLLSWYLIGSLCSYVCGITYVTEIPASVSFFISDAIVSIVQFSHLAWVQTDRKSGGLGDLNYPLVSDVTKSISKSYGVLIPDQVCPNI